MSQALIHESPNCGEISSNIYEDIVLTQLLGSLPPVTLTFWPINMSQSHMWP